MSNNRHTLARAPSAQRHHMIHPWLTTEAFLELEAEAKRRSLHVDVFAAQLIEAVVGDVLYRAVVDSD